MCNESWHSLGLGHEGSICCMQGPGNEGRISRLCLKELLKWHSLHHAAVTHSVFKCSLRRMQPLNWDTARITNYTGFYGFFIMVWAVFSCVQAVFFLHCKWWHVGAITNKTSKNLRFYFKIEWYLLRPIELGTLKWQQYVGQNIYQINISVELPLKDHILAKHSSG